MYLIYNIHPNILQLGRYIREIKEIKDFKSLDLNQRLRQFKVKKSPNEIMFDHSNATLCSHRSDLSVGVSIKVNQSLSIIKQPRPEPKFIGSVN